MLHRVNLVLMALVLIGLAAFGLRLGKTPAAGEVERLAQEVAVLREAASERDALVGRLTAEVRALRRDAADRGNAEIRQVAAPAPPPPSAQETHAGDDVDSLLSSAEDEVREMYADDPDLLAKMLEVIQRTREQASAKAESDF